MMNPDTCEFTPIESPDEAPQGWPVFKVGAVVLFRGWKWRIASIDKDGLKVTPLCAAANDHPLNRQEEQQRMVREVFERGSV